MSDGKTPQSGLASEIQQTRSFDSAEAEAYLNILRTASVLQDRVSALLQGHEISQPQYNVLRILRGAGEEGLPCGEVAERTITRVPDISRLLDRLHRRGLIHRQRDEMDRRVVRMTISDSGLQILAELEGPLTRLLPELLSSLDQEEIRELSRLLVLARS